MFLQDTLPKLLVLTDTIQDRLERDFPIRNRYRNNTAWKNDNYLCKTYALLIAAREMELGSAQAPEEAQIPAHLTADRER